MATAVARASAPVDELIAEITGAVAASAGTDPLALPPLEGTIDPDAIVALVDGDGLWDLTFSYYDHLVTVDGDGNVRVSPTESR